uniref:Uncharacterized protein n=1 Tax=Anguilla anguilla TaxID=7936 RepID=A0A0E9W3P9_ANGAN
MTKCFSNYFIIDLSCSLIVKEKLCLGFNEHLHKCDVCFHYGWKMRW